MSYEEKGTWVFLVVSAAVYAAYVAVVLSLASGGPLVEASYQAPLLWSIAASIVAAIVVRIVVEIVSPSGDYRADSRDKDIDRLSVYRSWWVLIAGAIAALLMALAEWPFIWIANVIYLGFVGQAVVGSIVKLVAYRRGF